LQNGVLHRFEDSGVRLKRCSNFEAGQRITAGCRLKPATGLSAAMHIARLWVDWWAGCRSVSGATTAVARAESTRFLDGL